MDLHETVVNLLLAERRPEGYWEGELASSALATATAVVALRRAGQLGLLPQAAVAGRVRRAIEWLLNDQNPDGSWGDAPGCLGNVAATYLVVATLEGEKTGNSRLDEACRRAWAYLRSKGELAALRERYGEDRTFVVPILSFLAVNGLVDWHAVPGLPFELGVLPHWLLRRFKVGVVSYALPALIAIGYAVAKRRGVSWVRRLTWPALVPLALRRLETIQPESGGYLEAVPLSAFVAISLMEAGEGRSNVVRRALGFLESLQRGDGSWPVDANLSCWLTSLSLQAIQRFPVGSVSREFSVEQTVQWLLRQQCLSRHPYTDAAPGGWGWSHLSGSVPDVDDTSAALLALRPHGQRGAVLAAAEKGVVWLLGVQNSDGGWPTFCRGWGWLPFDRSAPDLTAHALRALGAWRPLLSERLGRRVDRAIAAGLEYLRRSQRNDGAFVPLWFGNEWQADEENPVYGTARVLSCYVELARDGWLRDEDLAAWQRARTWLMNCRNEDGSWGGDADLPGTLEETSLAVGALADDPSVSLESLVPTLGWLEGAVSAEAWRKPAPIGLYFAKLWYYEKLYPLIFLGMATAALRQRMSDELAHDVVPVSGAA